ncbi:MAG: PAS domain S-box protein [Alphaproteobacteria bacterium]|nr:PAS domain S-box protein [Alphaproteobacteria bacterium]
MRTCDPSTKSSDVSTVHSDKVEELERELDDVRMRLDAALRALETTRNEASVGSWECDIATGRITWSERLREMLGIVDPDAALHDDIVARMHPDNVEHWRTQVSAAALSSTPIDIEIRLRRKHRNYVWLHMLGHVAPGPTNGPERIIGSAQDISYRKHAELDRTQIKERFELALQSLSVGIWDWNLVEKQLYWSPKYKELLGIRDLDFRPRPIDFEKRLHPEDRRQVAAALRDHLRNAKPLDCECRLRHENGQYLWIRLCGVAERNAFGKAIRMVGSVDDISVRKQAEQKLSEREARLRNMFDHAVDGIITIDSKGIVQSYNPACEKMFGYDAGEVVGKNISMLMPEPHKSQHDRYISNYLRTGHAKIIGIGREVEGRRKDGSLFPLDLSLSQFEVAGGEILFSGNVRDITSRKQVERMKNEFISVVSHELRTPLTSIRGSLGLLTSGRESSLPRRTMELLKIAQRNSELLMVLINDILDIEKLESGTMKLAIQPVEIAGLLADAVKSNSAYAARFDVRIKLRVEEDLPMVLADPDRLMQVVSNLLSNAAKFTRPGTVVDVHAGQKCDRIRISVRDHGQGVPDDLKGILFDKFFQADPSNSRERPGTGLGLSIARHFTRLMNGDIDFASEWGKGATFFVDLPIAEDEMDLSSHVTQTTNGSRSSEKRLNRGP